MKEQNPNIKVVAVEPAAILAAREENAGKNIVVLLPDSVDRYLSTPMFAE